jgi:hypothetical protein
VTELRRLFDAEPDDFALELLRSAHDDGPAAASFNQAAAALGVGAVLAGTTAASSAGAASVASLGSSAASAPATSIGLSAVTAGLSAAPVTASTAATITFAVLAKQAAIGMVAGLAVMGGFYATVGSSPDGTNPGAPAAHTQTSLAAAARPQRAPLSAQAPPASFGEAVAAMETSSPAVPLLPDQGNVAPRSDRSELERSKLAEQAGSARSIAARLARAPSSQRVTSDAPSGAPATVAEVPTVAFPATPVPAPSALAPAANDSLSLEVALLDRARSALAAGDATRSLSVLDEYQRGTPSGILAPEAQVLRIQVLERLGQTRAASALARDFVARHPGSRHAAALRALAERADARP